jgi:hypothetical protein
MMLQAKSCEMAMDVVLVLRVIFFLPIQPSKAALTLLNFVENQLAFGPGWVGCYCLGR